MNSLDMPRPLHRYRAYGLAIHSGLELPELCPDKAYDADVVVRRRPITRPYPKPPAATLFEFGAETQYLAWRNVARYLIRDQRQIDVDAAPEASEPLVRLPLIGPVMALLLHLRGLLVLHASAVAIGDRSVIFLGDKQAGKSTTAAALVAAGHRLLTDDTLAIDFPQTGVPRIVPGFPQIKLSLDAAAAVVDDGRQVQPSPFRGFEKRQHRLVDRFSHEYVAATRVYVLARGAKAAVTPLTPTEALMSLIRFSYVTRFGARGHGEAAAKHLNQCAALADAVEVGRLELPESLSRLEEAVRLVEGHLA
jgi:hypothetical protein